MPEALPATISAAVEGIVDEAVLRRLILHIGARPGPVHGRQGKQLLQQRITGYNEAARFEKWAVLVDLDGDADCAPPLVASWLLNPSPTMCFRVAVREVEAWLLADRERLSAFLGVAATRIPPQPESEPNPKKTMVDLAKRSRRRDIRLDMFPRPGSGRMTGPAYSSRLIEFASGTWRPDVAARSSDSLRRCLDCLRRLARGR
jgi:hypothetical protein